MASLVGGLLGHLNPFRPRGQSRARRGRIGQVVLRGASGRAYSFEVYDRAAAASLWEVGAVYCYARRVTDDEALAAGNAGGTGFDVGYVGRTADMAAQEADHERLGHFVGHAFDTLLILRIDEDVIRRDLEADLIATYDPALNELLRGYQGAGCS